MVSWVGALVVFGVVAITGMRFGDGAFDVPGTPSSEAMTVLDEEFPSDDAADTPGELQLVVRVPSGTVTDPGAMDAMTSAIADIGAIDGVRAVSDPFDVGRPYVSADLTTAVATVTVDPGAEAEATTERVDAVADHLREQGYTAEVGGSLSSGAPEILGPSELVGALLAFLVLFLTYGSLVAAGANMLGALLGVGVGILGVLGFSAITPIGSLTPVLAVMLGLAVGIDYCLFVLARYRSELRAGRGTSDAIARAVGTAGSAVVFAGATVIIALVGLSVVGIPFLGEMGLAAAFAVAVAVVMALTLLPAMLSLMGRRALPKRERGRRIGSTTHAGPAVLARWGSFVTRHRALSLVVGAGVLLVMAAPVLSMQTTLSVPGGEDPKSTQRAAYTLIADEFGAGAQSPLVVLAQAPDIAASQQAVVDRLTDLDGVEMVVPAGVSADGGTAMLTVFSSYGPLDERTTQLVRDVRAVSGEIDDTKLLVTGATAMGLDSDEQLHSALGLYIALIVGLSFLLLVVLFRSLLVPLLATVGFLLSLGAGLGATVAVFQWGWLDAVLPSPQGNPLLSLLPLVVTGILFGLAMDYQVFLVSRMKEAYANGFGPIDAIREGFRHSAGVVVAAAAIMAAVFGGFAMSPSSLVGAIALALTVGVVADAFVVRMIVVPAALALLGRAAWWMPTWLDRLLPTLDVEGHALDDDHTAAEPVDEPVMS
jgi:RND superfamily putative drug exporter